MERSGEGEEKKKNRKSENPDSLIFLAREEKGGGVKGPSLPLSLLPVQGKLEGRRRGGEKSLGLHGKERERQGGGGGGALEIPSLPKISS